MRKKRSSYSPFSRSWEENGASSMGLPKLDLIEDENTYEKCREVNKDSTLQALSNDIRPNNASFNIMNNSRRIT
jgi:hypothetical protein